jgi:hypothetical protein
MKALILGLLLLTTKTYASGCNPYDVYLAEETPVMSLGIHSAMRGCGEGSCYINTTKELGPNTERHYLMNEDKTDLQIRTDRIVDLEVKIYRQYFVSSCSEEYRYIIGTEYEGKRYREAADLTSL